MAQEPTYSGGEEEYKFTDAESNSNLFASADGEEESGGIVGKIIMLVVLLVFAFAGYKLYGIYKSHRKQVHRAPVVTKPMLPIVTKPVVPQPVVTTPPVVPAVHGQTLQAIQQRLQNLTDHSETRRSQIDELTSNVTNVQNRVADIDSKLADLVDNLQGITSQLNQQQDQLAAIKKLVTKPKRIVRRRKRAPIIRTHFFLQAAIPGRAWLMDDSGATLTVSKGSRLPGYGIVRKIDPQRGKVYTSSGYTISFKPGET